MAGVIQLVFENVGSPPVSQDMSAYLARDGSLQWIKSVNQSWTAAFTLNDKAGYLAAHRPVVGQPFHISQDGVVQFSGLISQVTEIAYPSTNTLMFQCQCSSWATILDHRVATASYPQGSIGTTVIDDIITRFCAGDGITLGHVAGFYTLPQDTVFSPTTVTDALNQLRTFSAEQWWIDESKDLHTQLIGLGADSGITISDNDGKWISGSMKVTTTTQNFRNVQYEMTAGPVGTQNTTEISTADGIKFFFVTRFPVTAVPVVKVNGVTQTMYQLGIDPYGQAGWYWAPQSYGVQQGQQIPPGAGSIITIIYDSFSLNYVVETNPTSIAARALIEGTSGRWEQIDNTANLGSDAIARYYADGQLSNYAAIPQQVTFDSYLNGFVIGDFITFAVTLHGLSGRYTITDVQAVEVPGLTPPAVGKLHSQVQGTVLYTVTVTNQPGIPTVVTFYQNMQAAILNATNLAGQALVTAQSTSTGAPITGAPLTILDLAISAPTTVSTAVANGATLIVRLTQDGTGSHAITWASMFLYPPSASLAPNTTTIAYFVGVAGQWLLSGMPIIGRHA